MKTPTVTLAGLQQALAAGRVRGYVSRGRRFASASEAEIRAAWTAAAAAWEAAPQAEKPAAWLPAADAEAELLLRDLPLPVPLIVGAEGLDGGEVVELDPAALSGDLAALLVDAALASRAQ